MDATLKFVNVRSDFDVAVREKNQGTRKGFTPLRLTDHKRKMIDQVSHSGEATRADA
jgi:hypothetical protein